LTKIGALFGRRIGVIIALLGLVAVAAAWHWTPLRQWVDFETLLDWERSFRGDPAAPYIIVGSFLLGGLFLFPVTVLTAVTICTFGPVVGNLYALVGWLSSAALGYGLGRFFGRSWIREIVGSRLDCLDRQAQRNGLLAVLAVRVVPVAPFTVVNLFIGGSRIRFSDFMIASVLGRVPGVLTLTLFGVQLHSLLHAPAIGKFALLLVIVPVLFLGHRWFSRQFVPGEEAVMPIRETPLLK
jgi:uncharacterized membrane protein YdjX (TVP38/TMEM64 family)